MTFDFDQDDDVLYVTFAEPKSGTVSAETDRGDVVRFCAETNEIAGVTIMFFTERAARGEKIDIPEVGAAAFSSLLTALLAAKAASVKTLIAH